LFLHVLFSEVFAHINPPSLSLSSKVPNSQVGLIIGKGGVTIKSIQERTGTNCQIPQAPDQDDFTMRTITVVGSSEAGCHAAVAEINGLLADKLNPPMNGMNGGMNGGRHDMSAQPHILVIKNEFAGAVIGKGGSTIRSIQEQTGARVQIPSSADMGSNPPSRSLTITGSREAQERAVREITEAIYSHGGPGGSALPRGVSISPEPVPMYGGGGYDAGYGAYGMYNDPYMMYQQQQQQQQAYYEQQQQQQQQQQGETPAVDMTAYYNDFWQYYAAYGEQLGMCVCVFLVMLNI
jgi:far upstream element-binding protein